MKTINKEYIKNKLLTRNPYSHKYDFGRVLIYAGSYGMAGAAYFSAKGALKSGAGLVTLALDKENIPILQSMAPEAICLIKSIELSFSRYEAIVFGPGLGDSLLDVDVFKKILEAYEGSLVIDADGLNNIKKYGLEDRIIKSKAQIIVTPHEGEALRLLGRNTIENRKKACLAISEWLDCTTVLKGKETLVFSKDNDIFMNTTGNSGMATGGSGDILSGMIGSLLAQGYSPMEASNIGVFIHGLAGDYSSKRLGEIGMLPSDILEDIPLAFNSINFKEVKNGL